MEKNVDTTELRYSLLIESDDYVSILDPQRKRKFVNKAYCSFLGKEEDDLLGQDFTIGLPDDKIKWYEEQIRSLTKENPTVSLTLRTGAEGKEETVSWKATGIFNSDGELLEIMAIGRNITDVINIRKEKNRILSTLNAFKKAIDTNIICTITDARGVITYANQNFCLVSKYTQEEIHGKTHKIVNSGFHPKSFFEEMWKTISSGKMWTADIKNRAKDGCFYWVNSVIIPIKDERGEITGYLSLRILIDEQKKIEEERKTYQKSLENMLFMVSHEIRKPIVTSQGLLYLLQEDLPATKEECIEFISYLISTTEELNEYSYKLNDYIRHNIKSVPASDN